VYRRAHFRGQHPAALRCFPVLALAGLNAGDQPRLQLREPRKWIPEGLNFPSRIFSMRVRAVVGRHRKMLPPRHGPQLDFRQVGRQLSATVRPRTLVTDLPL